jgi:ubiquinone biosynthesis accessory factor UbiJ
VNLATLIAPGLERAFNTYLRLDPDAPARLEPIRGKRIVLEIKGLRTWLLVRSLADKLQVGDYLGEEQDVRIAGSPLALARLGLTGEMDAGLTGWDIEIHGDAEVGRAFRELLAGVQIDWEELLAARVGDIPAHQVGNLARGLTTWLTQTAASLRLDIAEYLQEEMQIMPARVEVEQFMDEVDDLRMRLDRLEARIERLTQAVAQDRSPPAREA